MTPAPAYSAKIARVLIVAGSDSGGGAGIQADIKTVTMLGGHAMTAVTALTAQNTLGVQAVHPVPAGMVVAQMRSCIDDIGVDAVKIGMIGSAEIAHAVADVLEALNFPIVFDPVMVATSGSVLADPETIAAFERLMRFATVITPNLPELEALAGSSLPTEGEAHLAAHWLAERTGTAVLAKGGHRSPGRTGQELRPDGTTSADLLADNLLFPDGTDLVWTNRMIDTPHTHGTGCTLASGIAAGLGHGLSLPDAIGRAIRFTRAAIAHAPGLGGGHGPLGHALGVVPFKEIEGRCPA